MPRIDSKIAAINSANIATSTTPQQGQTQQHQRMTSKDDSDREKRLSTAKTTFKVVEALSGALPVVGTYVGAAAKVGSTIVEMIAGMDGNQELASRLEARVTSISEHLEHFKTRSRAHQKGETSKRVQDLQCQLKLVMKEMESIQSQGAVSRAFLSMDQGVKIKQHIDTVRTTWEELQLLVSLDTQDLIAELRDVEGQRERRELLNLLGDGRYGAHGDSIKSATCLPGTRLEILERIDQWVRGEVTADSQPDNGHDGETVPNRVLWIRGMAGRGKSTIATTVAYRWAFRGACALFHFRRGQNAQDRSLICALARQLGVRGTPEIRNAILQAIRDNPGILGERLEEQFDVLLVKSMQALPTPHNVFPTLLIVDALDECDDVDFAVKFVKLIAKHDSDLPPNTKFLLATRPEAPILQALQPRKWRMESLDTSQGLFQWAHTAIEYMRRGEPANRLRQLTAGSGSRGLDSLYKQILTRAFQDPDQSAESLNLLHRSLAILVAAPHPISLDVVAYMFASPEEWDQQEGYFDYLRKEVFRNIMSLIFIPESPLGEMQIMHTSIRDFLCNTQIQDTPYFINLQNAHDSLARKCIQSMNRDLKKNICNLTDLSLSNSHPEVQTAAAKHIPAGLIYCCRTWALHLTSDSKKLNSQEDPGAINPTDLIAFSTQKILFWVEVMSLIFRLQEAFHLAKRTELWLKGFSNQIDDVLTLWNDTQRWMTEFWEPIAFGALHIYASTMHFCPLKTRLWHYYHASDAKSMYGKQLSYWTRSIWTTIEHGRIYSIAFSPDGKRIASGSSDRTMRLWDAETGQQLGGPLEGHTDAVDSVAFSPDGKRIASGSRDRTVRLWDAETGQQSGDPLEGHTDGVIFVAFSPDGKRIASGSWDKTVRLWDAETGQQSGEPLEGHTYSVTSVAFSPDGKRIASGSWDGTVRLWDAETGQQSGEPFEGHSAGVASVAFSPDGKRVASGSSDRTVRLSDAETGQQLGGPLEGHTDAVDSVAFSPDGKRIASGSRDRTVRLWDAETGQQSGDPLEGHTYAVNSVAFSPDGKRIASGSWDGTVRLWDAETGQQSGDTLEGHSAGVSSVAFSPDGKRIASGSRDGTVRLWNAETGQQSGEPLEGHTDWILSVAFSPDGKRIASGSWNGTVPVWDAETGQQLGQPLEGHTRAVSSVAFSPDGKRIASGSWDGTVRLWDAETGQHLGEPLEGHTNWITSVAFSMDGKRIASGSWDGTVRLWDAKTGQHLGEPLTGPTNWITSVAFSPDGKTILTQDASGASLELEMPNLSMHVDPSVQSGFSLFSFNNGWVTYHGARVLWLPSRHWQSNSPRHIRLSGSTLVVADNYLSFFDMSNVLHLKPFSTSTLPSASLVTP
ncbi:POC1 centriolar protein A [Tulasnella sp. 427]|nr:POC1 centriolar protein A [Tulasnella sp. 427]